MTIEHSATAVKCYHCGQVCTDTLWIEEKSFCCLGCKSVFEILQENNLCEYYSFDKAPGVRDNADSEAYAWLDDTDIRKKIITFDSPEFSRVQFVSPAIHCSSCIWLLEHLERLHTGIIRSEVNFSRKTVTIDFHPQQITLSAIARTMSDVGYAPRISVDNGKPVSTDKGLVLRLAIAGFCFGNVMLFSFPEYLGLDHADVVLMRVFSWLNVALSVPVFFYSASNYFQSAFSSFKQKQINIDVPIALGLLALFMRSIYDVASGTGLGYLDSFTGLVFFLLIGRWFQSKTYETLAFDRDFKSYFPLAVNKLVGNSLKPVIIYDIEKGDKIRIRNMEIIPADSLLLDDVARIDYSFVTGESRPVKAVKGDTVYAGGRLNGSPVVLAVEKRTSQSHLTSLWNNDAFRKTEESYYKKIIDRAARRFTWIVMGIALMTGLYWYMAAPDRLWLVFTSVLMVACPCALALAAPFTYGSMLRAMGRNKLYLKNADVIERLASIDAVVFDKTGTVTTGHDPEIKFHGGLEEHEIAWVKTLAGYSTHPLSVLLNKNLTASERGLVSGFREIPGKGIEATIDGHVIRIGSYLFIGVQEVVNTNASIVFVSVDNEVRGYFAIATPVRKYMKAMLKRLGPACVALLSGDHEGDREKMAALFPAGTQLLFNQSPHDKLAFIQSLQMQGKKVMMVGDGLNDAGALKQADVGIAVTDDTAVFTPACDGILQGDQISALDHFAALARSATRILKVAFAISFLYNAIALTIAVSGHLTPLIAAILMPVSSISVVGFSSLAVRYVVSARTDQQVFIFNNKFQSIWKNIFLAKKHYAS